MKLDQDSKNHDMCHYVIGHSFSRGVDQMPTVGSSINKMLNGSMGRNGSTLCHVSLSSLMGSIILVIDHVGSTSSTS